jgi:Ca2+-binding EF-hand superfamily protein
MKDYSEAIISIRNTLKEIQSICIKGHNYDSTFDLINKLYEDVGTLNAYCQFQQVIGLYEKHLERKVTEDEIKNIKITHENNNRD